MIGGISTNSSGDDLVLEVFDGFLDILHGYGFDVICDEHPDEESVIAVHAQISLIAGILYRIASEHESASEEPVLDLGCDG